MRARTLLKALAIVVIRNLLKDAEKCQNACTSRPVSEAAPEPSTTRSTTTDKVVSHLQSLSELHTATLKLQAIVTLKEKKRRGIIRGSARLLYVAFGEIRAGIDLGEVSEKVDVDGTVHVRLPRVRILDASIDVERSYAYDITRSILFSPETAHLQTDAQQTALKQLTESALESGLLEVATENAVKMVKQLLTGLSDREFIVEIE